MKILVAALAAGSMVAATAGAASADGRRYDNYPHPVPPPHYAPQPNVAGAIVAGAFVGYALGALLAPRPVYPPPYVYAVPPAPVVYPPTYYAPTNPHVAWCISTYGSAYDIASDTVDYYGVPYRCVSPDQPQG
jgi:hypothetical protein